MNLSTEYKNLINSLVKDGYLKTPEIIEAFKAIDRKDFISEEQKNEAYVNAPLPIGFGQTISQPLTVAFMLELLEPKQGEKILDIGAGSGWVSALLAYIVSRTNTDYTRTDTDNIPRESALSPCKSVLVVAMERISELKEMAEKNIAKYNFIEKGVISIILGDGSKGYKKEAHYDKIIAAAAAKGELPKEWQKQLNIGGRIVAPLGDSIVVIDKIGKNKYNVKEHFGFSFVPLISS